MLNSKLLKIVTLFAFVTLISSFVAYRSGAFSKGDQTNVLVDESYHSNSGLAVDSPPAKKAIMYSSKSGPVYLGREKVSMSKEDSLTKAKEKELPAKKSSFQMDETMSSSKSGRIFDEKDINANQQATTAVSPVLTGTVINPFPVIMPSSKSGGIIRTTDVKAYSLTPASTITPAKNKTAKNQNNQPNQSSKPDQSNRANERRK